MSKQFGEFPDTQARARTSNGSKRKGKFELWMRYGAQDWHRWRKYESRVLAEQNVERMKREFEILNPEIEIRINE